jgi:predicted AAA+ superfamily ATPase
MVNPRKFYPIDPALIPLFDRTGRANRGHALETIVFLELERRRMEITYIRTPSGREVDFLVRDADNRTTLIQTCADMSDPETAKREFQSLEEAGRIFPQARRMILTLTAEASRLEAPEGIAIEPAYSWILRKEDQDQ